MTSDQFEASWPGEWPWDVLESFRELTREDRLRAAEYGGLLRDHANPETRRRERIDELVAQYRAHDAYKRLKRLPAFDSVMRERMRLAASNPLFADPLGELRLAYHIATIVGAHRKDFEPKQATRTHQEKVLRATRTLTKLLMPGAQPRDIFKMTALRASLREFEMELEAEVETAKHSGTRPARKDRDAAQRFWIVNFCKELIRSFGEAPATIVKDVAGMIGYWPDSATVGRYIKRATAQVTRDAVPDAQRKAMAMALRNRAARLETRRR